MDAGCEKHLVFAFTLQLPDAAHPKTIGALQPTGELTRNVFGVTLATPLIYS